MPDDETLSRSRQHGVDGARSRCLIRNFSSDVGRYTHPLVETGQARRATTGPVVLGASTKHDVRAQQGLRWPMVEHGLVEKRDAQQWQDLEFGNLLAELRLVDIEVDSQ